MTASRDDTFEQQPAVQLNSAQKVHRVARQLQQAVPDRAQREEAIKTAFETESQKIEQEYEQRRDELHRKTRNALDEADRQWRRAQKLTEAECDAARAESDRMAEQLHAQTHEKAQANRQAAQDGLQEAVWMAETMFEANEAQPKEQFDQLRKTIEAHRAELDRIDTEATARLRKYRQKPAHIYVADAATDDSTDVNTLQQHMADIVDAARDALGKLSKLLLPKLFTHIWPLLILIIGGGIGSGAAVSLSGWELERAILFGSIAGVVAAVILMVPLYFIARHQVRRVHRQIAQAIGAGHEIQYACVEAAEQRRDEQVEKARRHRDIEINAAKKKYQPILGQLDRRRDDYLRRIEEKHERQLTKITSHLEETIATARGEYEQTTTSTNEENDRDNAVIEQWHNAELQRITTKRDHDFQALERDWSIMMNDTYSLLSQATEAARPTSMPWTEANWRQWSQSDAQTASIRFGRFDIDVAQLPGGVSADERLALPGPAKFELPALLHVPGDCSLLIETQNPDDRQHAIAVLQNVMARLLTALPPGKARFVIIDPIALGQNFAGFMHLADYEGNLVGQRIWTESAHIQQRLTDLTEHMENVIQKYLRNEFESIDRYNIAAGEIAEPYRFLIISDFPANFTDEAARRLLSIVNSGGRCGVHTIIHRDTRQELPRAFDLDELKRSAACLSIAGGKATWQHPKFEKLPLTVDDAPSEALLTEMMHDVGRLAVESTRVEVPFESVVPKPDEQWSRSASKEIRVPVGRSGATKIQELSLGRDTSQHALIAGKTGSGKSTLLHVIITSLALWYKPDEVELYLVDFKKGVEFKTYGTHQLPHARVIAIESDREFGLSVLQRLDAEMRRRGDLYRAVGAQDVAGFRAQRHDEPMPRILLVIDEFQEFFTEDDRVAQEAALLLDRLVRQGRAFGMHVLLGSQTLGGAYTLARSTMGQMNVRIALQCSETDSYLIMNEDNAAARLLNRPGEAIYNDAAGLVEGNSPFQIVWLPEEKRETYLQQVKRLTDALPNDDRIATQVVFEGNTPGRLDRNPQLAIVLAQTDGAVDTKAPMIWFGDPVAIKDPTAAALRHRGGSNLLIVGQQDEMAEGLLTATLLSLAAQFHPGKAKFVLLDSSPSDAARIFPPSELAKLLPHDVLLGSPREAADIVNEIAVEVRRRHDENIVGPPVYIIIDGLQRFRTLKYVDDYSFSTDADKPPSPDKQFATILREGPDVAVHVITWCDSMNNLNRMLERATLREFEMRVLMQMSAADSTALIDTPEASRLGMHRAIFASEESGVFEKFRPYGPPDRAWLDRVMKQMRSKADKS